MLEEFSTKGHGSKVFFNLHLCQGYPQVSLHPDSHNLTTFVTDMGGLPLHLHDLHPQFQKLPEDLGYHLHWQSRHDIMFQCVTMVGRPEPLHAL